MKILRGIISLIFLLSFAMPVLSIEKTPEQQSLPKEHVQKLKRIAEFITGEMTRKRIKTVTVEDFKDFKGNLSAKGKVMAKEFRRQLTFIGAVNLVNTGAETIVTGILIPFKEDGKWKLDIKVISSDRGKIITSYTGIFKKPRGVKRVKK